MAKNEFDELAEMLDGEPAAASLVMQIMERNAAAAQTLDAQILQWAEQDRDKWKARAIEAEALVKRMEHNVLDMLYAPRLDLDPG